ncbi:MAG: oligosaccharide flippase family protein [Eubacteriales bacterium]|nr:oligosaccharide flippase family protein [Eubacteriales bacterium]
MGRSRQNIKQRYISCAFILLISTVVVKIISAVYKIPLTAYIGATGRGYFSLAYNLCLPIHALTMGAFPIALSKLVSTYNVKGDYLKIKAVKKASGRLFFIIGVAGLGVMLIAAKPYSEAIASSPKSIYTILALAPSVFFSCLAAGKRAFAEGYLDMKPTAISQIIEALFKMVFGLLLARYSMSALYDFYVKTGTVLGNVVNSEEGALAAIYPLTSAAAMAGVTLGSIASWIFAGIYTSCRYKSFPSGRIDVKEAMNELVMFSVPLVGATVFQSISNFVDTASIQYALSLCDSNTLLIRYPQAGEDVYTYVYGIYSAALDYKNLVPGIVMALGVTAVPAVSAAYESSQEHFSSLMTSILKYTSILASAGGVVLSLFSRDILNLFYGSNNADIVDGGEGLLFLFGVTMMPCCIASTAVFCVQSLGYSKQTIAPFAVSSVVRALINYFAVGNVEINILGTAYSNFAGFFIITVWCLAIIRKKTNCRIRYKEIFIKPVICTSVTFFTVKFIREGIFNGLSEFVSFGLSVLVCVVILIILLFLFRCISFKELKSFK